MKNLKTISILIALYLLPSMAIASEEKTNQIKNTEINIVDIKPLQMIVVPETKKTETLISDIRPLQMIETSDVGVIVTPAEKITLLPIKNTLDVKPKEDTVVLNEDDVDNSKSIEPTPPKEYIVVDKKPIENTSPPTELVVLPKKSKNILIINDLTVHESNYLIKFGTQEDRVAFIESLELESDSSLNELLNFLIKDENSYFDIFLKILILICIMILFYYAFYFFFTLFSLGILMALMFNLELIIGVVCAGLIFGIFYGLKFTIKRRIKKKKEAKLNEEKETDEGIPNE